MRLLKTLKNREGKPIDINKFKDDCSRLLADKNIIVAYLYGSYAIGNPSKLSDVDIAVLFEPAVPREEYLERELDLISVFQNLVEDEAVDLGRLNNAPLTFAFQVIEKGIPIFCSDEKARVKFESIIMTKYYDFKPLILEYRSKLFEQIKEGKLSA